MKSKILSLIFCVVVVIIAVTTLVATISAAEYRDPTVAVECSEIGSDNTFTAEIVLYNNPGISGYYYALRFDNSKIQIVDVLRDEDDVPESVFPAEATLNIEEPGSNLVYYSEIRAYAARAKASDKNGVLLTIIFKVVGEFEQTILSIDDEMFVDVNRDEVNFTIVDDSVGLPKIEGVTFDGATFVYDGTEKSIAVKGATSAMTVEYSPKTAKNVGTNKITATVKQAGYATLTLTANIVITPKTLTIDGVKVTDKTFDNTTAAKVDYTNAKLVGVVAGDDVTFTKPAATFADANVGTGKTMTMDAITLGGAAAGNYILTQPTLEGVIIQRTVTIVPDAGQGKKIGTVDPVLTYTVDGDLCGYTLVGDLSRSAGEDAGELSKTYNITIGTLKTNPDNGNIKLVVANEVFTIFNKDPQDVTVTAPTSVLYGATDAKVAVTVNKGTTATPTFATSDAKVVTVAADGTITTKGVGKATITVTVAGDDTYAPFTKVVEVEVKGIPVTVTPTAGQTFVYGSKVEIAYTANVDGVNFTGALALASTDAGTQTVVIGTLAAANYEITVANATVTITPKTLTITGVEVWPTKTPEVNMNSFSPAASGIISGDNVYIASGVVGAIVVGGKCVVTSLTLGGRDSGNYVLDTTVSYNYTTDKAAADYVANFLDDYSYIMDTGSDMTTAGLIDQITDDVTLPSGVAITGVTANVFGIIDADGNIVRPLEDTVVTFTFTVVVDGATSTFSKTLTIVSPSIEFVINSDGMTVTITRWKVDGDAFVPSTLSGYKVTGIGSLALANLSELTSVTIPDTVTKIEGKAFFSCQNLEKIIVDKNNVNYCDIDGVLFTKDMKTLVAYPGGGESTYVIPDWVTDIADSAFAGCYNLSSVILSDNMIGLGTYAFGFNYKLKQITISDMISKIDAYAFYRCSDLTTVIIESRDVWIAPTAFNSCSKLDTVYCYKNSTADEYFSSDEYTKVYFPADPGDCNGDGVINAKDSVLISQSMAKWDVEIDIVAADCNGDGQVNSIDAVMLVQYLAGWDVTLG